MYSARDLHKGGVSPFGHLRINDRSHLPAAYRSVPRPSSPLGAKASTERPSFTQIFHRPHAGPTRKDPHPSVPRARASNRTAATPRTLATLPPLTTNPPNNPSGSSRQPAAQESHSTHQIIFTCQRTRETASPRRSPLGRAACFPKTTQHRQEQASARSTTRPQPKTHPVRLGDGRYRTDDPLLAKQALSH
jgi:hypothetical protein